MLDLDVPLGFFDSNYLSFLMLEGYGQVPHDEGERVPMGLHYCLEAGVIHWYGTPSDQSSPLYLRDNADLAMWEPMTADKMGLLAVELGVMGDYPRVPWMEEGPSDLSAMAVSPHGFVLKWPGGDNIYISDVQTLAGIEEASAEEPDNEEGQWEGHSLNRGPHDYIRYGGGQAQATEESETDLPILMQGWTEPPTSLAEWGFNVVPPVAWDPRTKMEAEFSADAASFVQSHFGVDVSAVERNRTAANRARLLDAKYSKTTPFNPHRAIAALHKKVAANAVKARTSPSLGAGPTHVQTGGHRPPPERPSL
jgi:hypothetical protein